jgi:hypothetical protein
MPHKKRFHNIVPLRWNPKEEIEGESAVSASDKELTEGQQMVIFHIHSINTSIRGSVLLNFLQS